MPVHVCRRRGLCEGHLPTSESQGQYTAIKRGSQTSDRISAKLLGGELAELDSGCSARNLPGASGKATPYTRVQKAMR